MSFQVFIVNDIWWLQERSIYTMSRQNLWNNKYCICRRLYKVLQFSDSTELAESISTGNIVEVQRSCKIRNMTASSLWWSSVSVPRPIVSSPRDGLWCVKFSRKSSKVSRQTGVEFIWNFWCCSHIARNFIWRRRLWRRCDCKWRMHPEIEIEEIIDQTVMDNFQSAIIFSCRNTQFSKNGSSKICKGCKDLFWNLKTLSKIFLKSKLF